MNDDVSYCPHCDARVHSEWEGPYRIQPDCCENGCHEFYDAHDCLVSDDQEAACGWWKHEGMTKSNVVVTERDKQRIEAARRVARKVQDAKDKEHAKSVERLKVKKRYIDEALF